MSVLAEALSVIVRVETIETRFPGGLTAYRSLVPNRTFCTDGVLTRVGFFGPPDVQAFVERISVFGLALGDSKGFIDIAVVDQHTGPTLPCNWLEFRKHPDGYSVVSLLGVSSERPIATPEGWTPAQSAGLHFSQTAEFDKRFIGLTSDDGLDTLLDTETGRFTYTARAMRAIDEHALTSSRSFPVIVEHDGYCIVWVNRLNAWPRLLSLLDDSGDLYLPFFQEGNAANGKFTLTARALFLGVLLGEEPPAACAVVLDHNRAAIALSFASAVAGKHPDEFAASAAAYLAEQVDWATSIKALSLACQLVPNSVLARGDLVVRLFEVAIHNQELRPRALREAGRVFLDLSAGSTKVCANEEAVLVRGILALEFSGATGLAQEAVARHRARLPAYPDALRELQRQGIIRR